jgi:hypothetical protein
MFSWLLYCYSGFYNAFCVEFRERTSYVPPMPMSPSASITRSLSLTVFAFFDIPFPPRGRLLGPDVGGSATETGVAAPDGFALASSKCPSPVKWVSNLLSDLVAAAAYLRGTYRPDSSRRAFSSESPHHPFCPSFPSLRLRQVSPQLPFLSAR